MPSISRRKTLALLGGGTGIVLAGGAVALADPFNTPLMMITNRTEQEQEVSTVVRSENRDEAVVDDTVTIQPDDTYSYPDLVSREPLLVTIRTGNGLERSFRWTETDPENGLSVVIRQSEIGFAVASPP